MYEPELKMETKVDIKEEEIKKEKRSDVKGYLITLLFFFYSFCCIITIQYLTYPGYYSECQVYLYFKRGLVIEFLCELLAIGYLYLTEDDNAAFLGMALISSSLLTYITALFLPSIISGFYLVFSYVIYDYLTFFWY